MNDEAPSDRQPDPVTAELLSEAWTKAEISFESGSEDHVLFQDEARTIFYDSSWGPPIPYPPARRRDGNLNHGYIATKGNPEAIAAIAELQDWPDYESLIQAINCATGTTETVGCEKGFFDCDAGAAKVYLGSYTDIVFSKPSENSVLNHLRLATKIAHTMRDARSWWGKVELGIQRMKGRREAPDIGWGLHLKILNFGRDPDEARKWWGHSAELIAEAFRSHSETKG